MNSLVFVLAFTTFLSTLVGGSFAVKFRRALPYFFAFAAGTLIAVTFFDILPESLSIASLISLNLRYIMITLVAAFVLYSFIERFFMTHEEGRSSKEHRHIMGPIGAGGLVVHSLLDGIAIGTAFQVNPSVGLIVAFAVIFHDFTDGINTVTLMLKNNQKLNLTIMFLLLDAMAPVVGVLFASLLRINVAFLAFILAAFSGEFLYIGAAQLLPSTLRYKTFKMSAVTVAGILLIFFLTSILSAF